MTSSCHSERSEESERIRSNVFRFFFTNNGTIYMDEKSHPKQVAHDAVGDEDAFSCQLE